MVCQGKRRSFRIRTGDIVRIPAGITLHLINSHKNQKLRIAYFLLPVGIPGRFEVIILPCIIEISFPSGIPVYIYIHTKVLGCEL